MPMPRCPQAGISWAAVTRCATIRTAFYEAQLSDSENVESWEEGGATDMRRRAYDRWNEMLKQYEAPPIDAAKKDELTAYVAKRKEELPDAWY